MRLLVLFFLFGAVLSACKKPEDRKCWKSAGVESELEIDLPTFKNLWLGPHMNFVLVQDTVCKAIVKGGKNLIHMVQFNLVDDEMQVVNGNSCAFLRSYKKEITVEIHINQLDKIQFEGTKPLICQNQIKQDYLSMVIRDGAGNVDLNIEGLNLTLIVTHGWGNFNLHGKLNYLKIETNGSGFGSAYDINVMDSIHVISNSSNDVKVEVNNALFRGQTKSMGSIYYRGNPALLEFNKYGDGTLINDN